MITPKIHTSICEYFKLGRIPFLGQPKRPFIHDDFERNLSLLSTVFYSRQVAVLHGPAGSGKSSLIFYALNELDPSDIRVVSLELSNPNKKSLYKTLALKMGLKPAYLADDIKNQLINFFYEENAQNKFNCVIIDEAHSLSIELIDELRSFFDEGKNFSLVLLGLPSLFRRKLNLSVTLPMKQRVSLFLECTGLTLSETKDYVSFQLKEAKSNNNFIDDKCFPLLHSTSGGMPRVINQICYGALLECYSDNQSIVDEDTIKKITEQLAYN